VTDGVSLAGSGAADPGMPCAGAAADPTAAGLAGAALPAGGGETLHPVPTSAIERTIDRAIASARRIVIPAPLVAA
jgi:hypothetical protein